MRLDEAPRVTTGVASEGVVQPGGQDGGGSGFREFSPKTLVLPLVVWVAWLCLVAVVENGLGVLSLSFWISSKGTQLLSHLAMPVVLLVWFTVVTERLRSLRQQFSDVVASVGRLADPEPASTGKIISIRHAVHKELATLNEHLERSLNRTSEIEAVIRREVGTLENSFADNERRMLGLVQELARQRETVITATDQVRDVVKVNRELLNEELGKLAAQVLEAGNYARGVVEEINVEVKGDLTQLGSDFSEMLRETVDSRIRPISNVLGEQVRTIDALLSDGGDGLVQTFEKHGQNLVARLDSAWTRIGGQLTTQTKQAEEMATRITGVLEQNLESNVNKLESKIRSASLEVMGALDSGAEQAAQRIVEAGTESTQALDSRIVAFRTQFDGQLQRFGQLVDGTSARFIPVLEKHNGTLQKAIELEEAFEQSTARLSGVLTEQAAAFVDALSDNIHNFEAHLGDRAHHVSDGLVDKLDRAVSTLDTGTRRFETALQNVQDSFSLASDKLTISVAETNAEFAHRLDAIESLVTEGAERIDERLVRGVHELAAALDQGSERVDQTLLLRIGRIGEVMADQLDQADATFLERVEQLRGMEEGHNAKLRETMAAAAASVSALIHEGGNVLDKASDDTSAKLAVTLAQFDDQLGELRGKLDADLRAFAQTTSAALAETGGENVAALDAKMGEIAGALQERVAAIYGNLEARTREFEANIVQFGSSIDAQTTRLHRVIAQRSEAIEQQFDSGIGRFDMAMEVHLGRAESTVADFVKFESEIFVKRLESMSEAFDGQSKALEDQLNRVQGSLDSHGRQFEARISAFGQGIESQADRLDKVVTQRSTLFERAAETGASRIDELLAEHLKRQQEITENFIEDEGKTFDRQSDILARTLDSRAEVLESIMRTRGSDFTDQFYAASKRFEEELVSASKNLEATLRSGGGELQEKLAAHTAEMRASFEQAIRHLAESAKARLDETSIRIGDVASEFDTTVEQRSSSLIRALGDKTGQLERSLEAGTSRLGSVLAQETQKLADTLGDGAMQLRSGLDARIGEVSHQLKEQTTQLVTTVGETSTRLVAATTQLDSSIEQRSATLVRALGEKASVLERTLEAGGDRLSEILGEETEKLGSALKEGSAQLRTSLDARIVEVTHHLKEQTSQLVGSVGETGSRLVAVTAELDATLEQRSSLLMKAVGEKAGAMERAIETGTARLTTVLGQETDKLTTSLNEGSSQLRSSLEAKVGEVSAQLRDQTGQVVATLGETGEKVGKAVEQAGKSLEKSVQQNMTSARTTLQKSLDGVSRLLTTGVETTQQQVQSSVEGLITKLNAHEKNAVGRMEAAATNVGESTRKAAELTAERLVTLNGALVQVLNSLGSTRPASRKSKPEALADAAE